MLISSEPPVRRCVTRFSKYPVRTALPRGDFLEWREVRAGSELVLSFSSRKRNWGSYGVVSVVNVSNRGASVILSPRGPGLDAVFFPSDERLPADLSPRSGDDGVFCCAIRGLRGAKSLLRATGRATIRRAPGKYLSKPRSLPLTTLPARITGSGGHERESRASGETWGTPRRPNRPNSLSSGRRTSTGARPRSSPGYPSGSGCEMPGDGGVHVGTSPFTLQIGYT